MKRRLFSSMKPWYISSRRGNKISHLSSLYGIEVHFIFQNFWSHIQYDKTGSGVPDLDLTNIPAAAGWGVSRPRCRPAVYNTRWLSTALRSCLRLGSGPGGTRLGGCYCFCLYVAWGTWARSLRTQLSSFFYWQIQGLGLVTDPRQVPATRGSVIHLHTRPTHVMYSAPQRSLWSQKGNGHIHRLHGSLS